MPSNLDSYSLGDLAPELGLNLRIPWFDVTDKRFSGGAKGDNSTDDYAAIQAAINAVPTVNWRNGPIRAGVVYFPAGSYVCRTALTLPQTYSTGGSYQTHITLQGAGWRSSMIRRQNGDNNILIDASGTNSAGNAIVRTAGFQMKDIGLNGADGTQIMLRMYYVTHANIDNCYFQSNNGPAIEGVSWQDSHVVNNWFDYCGGATDSNLAGTAAGKEAVRLLNYADNAVTGTFGFATEPTNAIWFQRNHFTSLNTDTRGQIVVSANGSAQQPHRISFVQNKIECQEMGGNQVKLFNCQKIHFDKQEFTGYGLHAGATAVSWVEANNADQVSIRSSVFDDNNTAGVTHAGVKLTNCDYWTLEDVTYNFGTVGAEANPAVIADFTGGGNTNFFLNNHSIANRLSPKFSGTLPTPFFGPVRGDISTQTPGVTSTVNIAHGLGYAPATFGVEPASLTAANAPAFYRTADATNVILNFVSNLSGATSYSWRWMAS